MNSARIVDALFGGVVTLLTAGLNQISNSSERRRQCRVLYERAQRTYNAAVRREQRQHPLILLEETNDQEWDTEDPRDLRQEAQRLLDQTLDIGPDRSVEARVYLLQARLLFDDKAFEECVEYASKALKLKRRLAMAYEVRCQGFEALGREELALADYRQIHKLDPHDTLTWQRIQAIERRLGLSAIRPNWPRLNSRARKRVA